MKRGEGTSFAELVRVCQDLQSTSKRTEKIRLVGAFLHSLAEEEISPAVSLVLGRVFPQADERRLEIGWRTVGQVKKEASGKRGTGKGLSILAVRQAFDRTATVRGKGAQEERRALLRDLYGASSEAEQEILTKILFGEMQHGVGEGVMVQAVAETAGVALDLIRRAVMCTGDVGEVVRLALTRGVEGVAKIGLRLFRPVQPMLAALGKGLEEVLAEHGGKTALEYKFDGARVQIHKKRDAVRIFSRRLSEVTASLPDVVRRVRENVEVNEAVVEGEVVAVGEGERPLPFQDLMRRFRRLHDVERMVDEVPVRLHLFDCLYMDGESLLDETYGERWKRLSNIVPELFLTKRLVTSDVLAGEPFLRQAMEAGHEGLMAKDLKGLYTPGTRGKRWLKIKPAETLDLVIVAADWGYGRRTGWLSNYHLAARDEETGTFPIIGKTFKGMTDEGFIRMTERLQGLKTGETRQTVVVKPETVVEVAYNEIQKSRQYPSGFALRFARVKRVREDKGPAEADTLGRVRTLYEKQFERKARRKGLPE